LTGPISNLLPPVAVFDNYWAPTLAFAKSLGKRQVPLHFYGAGAGRWSRYCTRRNVCPPVEDADRFLPWLTEKIRTGEITRVAPTTDLIAYYVSVLREEFPPEVQRSIAPLEEIEACLIKTKFSEACVRHSLPVALTKAPRSVEEAFAAALEIGYPLIIKPKSHLGVGTAERGHLVHNAAELREYYRPYQIASGQSCIADRYAELRWPLLQRYLPSAQQRVYSVSGIKDADLGIVAATLTYKREQWPPDVGTSTVQISCQDEHVLSTGLKIVDCLISRGIFELELLADGNDLLPIDLNPRAFGFIELDVALGRDLPWLWFRSTMEKVSPMTDLAPQAALEARNTLLFFLRRVFSWRPSLLLQRTPTERRNPQRPRVSISMLGHWSDPVPMLISYFHLLRHPRSLIKTQFVPKRSLIAPVSSQ
jgi:D-aspartate ligase